MHFSFSFPWNREPGTYNCRLKKRTGLGPHPTLEKPQFWPLFRSMSGVLKLLILESPERRKTAKNSAPTGTCPSTPLYVQVTTGKLGPRITSEWPTIRELSRAGPNRNALCGHRTVGEPISSFPGCIKSSLRLACCGCLAASLH